CGRGCPARGGVHVVTRDGAIAVLVAVVSGGDAGEVGDDVLDLRLNDHLLTFQDAAQQQPDDHQNDRDFHQREALLRAFHDLSPLETKKAGRVWPWPAFFCCIEDLLTASGRAGKYWCRFPRRRESRPAWRRASGWAPSAANHAPFPRSTRRRPSAYRPRWRSCPAGSPSTRSGPRNRCRRPG